MMKKIIIVLVSALTAFIAVSPKITNAAWQIEAVDSAGYEGEYTSLALDSEGKAHISYSYDNGIGLKYATNMSGAWVTETVDSDGGMYTSLALDSEGKAHISYLDFDITFFNYALKYATNKTGAWIAETVDRVGDVGWDTSLALDSEGKAHISYSDSTNGDLKYATNKTGAWVIETVADTGGSDSSLALDSEGKAHISYSDYGIMYATNKSGAWVFGAVPSNHAGNPSLALDSEGKAHISFHNELSGDLEYATNKSGAWAVERVDGAGEVIFNSLALDSEGKAHVSYLGLTYPYYALTYATNESGVWETEIVDTDEYVGRYNSLALDAEGKVHISYLDYANRDLKYARQHCETTDSDCDGVLNELDNCPNKYNHSQLDNYPPLGNGIGDACDCEGNFDCDSDTDGTDAATFKADFGRSQIQRPCTANDICNGDFACDGDVDGTDAALFKQNFGRSAIQNSCPVCVAGVAWCSYQ